ncbi:MAG: CoA-binding protein [Candidatus Bathyarchaeota archaeon]|nr:CoA-binding protein [Candidatus Bathyarchaeota archaeon]MDH5636395.1 CoA-binding protein [Candidatus Bathyarchaeota archaeon]MDH5701658.1 CoA-binding protein [Candidatus Bathyarchaeota archaeon]
MKNSINEELKPLFYPKSVAVIGASNNPAKWGFSIFNDLLIKGFKGDLYPVNKNEERISGITCYKSVKDVPRSVDLAVIAVPAQIVPTVMKECVEKGVKTAVIISAGFREAGGGEKLEEEVLRIARQGGIRFVGPNCFGIINPFSNLSTTGLMSLYITPYVPKGSVAVITQSGNLGTFMLKLAFERGFGISKFVSSGNEADLHFEDYLEYMAEDPDTKIIVGYVEELREGRRFSEMAKEITEKKPIVILKAGRTKTGHKAAKAHTGALAGSDDAYGACFKQAGVIRVREIQDLFDVAVTLVSQPLPRGKRVGIVTGGGGFGVVAADMCEELGLEIPQLTQGTLQKLNQRLPPRWSHSNPVDMVGTMEYSYVCIGTLLKDENVDSVLAISSVGSPSKIFDQYPPAIRNQLAEFAEMMVEWESTRGVTGLIERIRKYKKPVILAAPPTSREESEAIGEFEKNGIVVHPTPERAIRILAYVTKYAEDRKRKSA